MAKATDDLLKQVNWGEQLQWMVGYARRKLGFGANIEDAREVASEGMRIFFKSGCDQWDPNVQSLKMKLGSIINGVLVNRRRNKPTNLEVPHDLDKTFARVATPLADPEESAILESQAKCARQLLEVEIKGDDLVEQVFMLTWDGTTEVAAQAAQMGVSKSVVYKARHRFGLAREKVLARMRREE